MKMNLWIRSQDKRILQKVDNIFLDANYGNERICSYDNDSKIELGTYKTKERALEILDEIEERIMLINTINIAKDTNSLIACKIALMEKKIKGLSYPYQMPEE
mgnify:CR=1 FL=1